jgi:hypothetical protein
VDYGDRVEITIKRADGIQSTVVVNDGEPGEPGSGIEDIVLEKSEGLVDTYAIIYQDGNKVSRFTVTNGRDGESGEGGGGAVMSVNGKIGDVVLTAEDVKARPDTWMPTATDVGARPDTWMPTAEQVGARPNTWMPTAAQVGARPNTWTPTAEEVGARPDDWMPTAEQVGARADDWLPTPAEIGARPINWMPSYSDVGADKAGTAQSLVSGHNTNTGAHNDLRLLIASLAATVNDLLDSTDEDLNELHEIVEYIKNNKSLIDGITTNKVNVSDIINNLTTNVTNKPLSAAQGVVLKGLIDGLASGKLDASALTNAINTALAQAKASGEFDGKNGEDGKDGDDGTDGTDGVGIADSEINANGELVLTYTDGNEKNVGRVKGEDGALTPDQEELLAIIPTLKDWYEQETYEELAFVEKDEDGNELPRPTYKTTTLEMRPDTNKYEVTFTWEFNKTPTTLTYGDTTITDEETIKKTTSCTESFYSTTETTKVFSVEGKMPGKYKEEEVAKRDWTFLFRNKVYYGVNTYSSSTATIMQGLSSRFATDFKHSGFNPGDSSTDKYIWYCYPRRFEDGGKTPTFTLGGFQGGFKKYSEYRFENSSGFTEWYCVYRSTNPGVGNSIVTVS